jgi:peptide methionine sulfoxide reductase MsrA
VEVNFDPEEISFDKVLELYFETHDFTQVGGQGPDIGTQYRSVIFYTDEKQKETAEKYIAILSNMGTRSLPR